MANVWFLSSSWPGDDTLFVSLKVILREAGRSALTLAIRMSVPVPGAPQPVLARQVLPSLPSRCSSLQRSEELTC